MYFSMGKCNEGLMKDFPSRCYFKNKRNLFKNSQLSVRDLTVANTLLISTYRGVNKTNTYNY